jgi:hypothetical protein
MYIYIYIMCILLSVVFPRHNNIKLRSNDFNKIMHFSFFMWIFPVRLRIKFQRHVSKDDSVLFMCLIHGL